MLKTVKREELESMTISRLRGLNIETPQEEQLVQEILNEKLRNEPQEDLNRVMYSSTETDFMTPEKETELQRKMNGEVEEPAVEPVVEPVGEPIEEPIEVPTEMKRFCEFCSAKGPIKHMKSCTKV